VLPRECARILTSNVRIGVKYRHTQISGTGILIVTVLISSVLIKQANLNHRLCPFFTREDTLNVYVILLTLEFFSSSVYEEKSKWYWLRIMYRRVRTNVPFLSIVFKRDC
jgi:hypothetical protein